MNNEKKEKLFINIVLALFILGIIFCFTLYPILCDTVSAEPLTENSVLNFNQLVLNENINRTYPKLSVVPISKTDLNIVNHKFYLHFDKNTAGIVAIGYNNGSSNVDLAAPSSTGSFDYIFTSSKVVYFSVYSTVDNLHLINFNIVDLTQCFGAGNEPSTVEEFKSYFVNDSYSYTLSSLISLGTQDAYNKGVNDTLTNLSYSFTAVDSYNRITSANVIINNVSYNSTLDKTTLATDFVSLGVPGSTQNGVLYFPFSTTLNAGDTISLSGYYGYAVFGSGSHSVDIVVVNGDSFSKIDTSTKTGSTINDLKHIENLNYTLPFSCSGIYFISKGAGVYVSNFTVSVQVLNFQSLINDAYDAGKASRDSDITIAFENGRRQGLTESNPYTFNALFGAVFDAPIQALTGLLDFNILGVNMKGLYLSLFTLALIIFVIKLCLGKV